MYIDLSSKPFQRVFPSKPPVYSTWINQWCSIARSTSLNRGLFTNQTSLFWILPLCGWVLSTTCVCPLWNRRTNPCTYPWCVIAQQFRSIFSLFSWAFRAACKQCGAFIYMTGLQREHCASFFSRSHSFAASLTVWLEWQTTDDILQGATPTAFCLPWPPIGGQ